jgi:predicted RNA-binding Zn ribbon-like protein
VNVTLPSWVPAGERKPAPVPLLLVQSFVNTRDLETGADVLSDPGPAAEWLRDAGLLGRYGTLTAADLRLAQQVRESIRALLARNSGGPAPTAAGVRPLQVLARTAQPRVTVDPSGNVQLGPGDRAGVADGLLGLLLITRDSQRSGEWRRLKVCRNRDCGWAFFDRSHSRRGAWCDMAACGNLIKNRNFRARRVAGA